MFKPNDKIIEDFALRLDFVFQKNRINVSNPVAFSKDLRVVLADFLSINIKAKDDK